MVVSALDSRVHLQAEASDVLGGVTEVTVHVKVIADSSNTVSELTVVATSGGDRLLLFISQFNVFS